MENDDQHCLYIELRLQVSQLSLHITSQTGKKVSLHVIFSHDDINVAIIIIIKAAKFGWGKVQQQRAYSFREVH